MCPSALLLGEAEGADGQSEAKWLIFLAKGVAKLQPLTVS
jgi:hypothetical protein